MSREKHVFATSEIAHKWAHQTQTDAKNPRHNFWYEGDTIYSYRRHFPIARHVYKTDTRLRGSKNHCILFTTKRYSVTTSQHISQVSCAIPGDWIRFNVPDVRADSNTSHQLNLQAYLTDITYAISKCSRARASYQKTLHHNRAVADRRAAIAYAKFFKVKCPKLPIVPDLDSEELADIRKKEAEKTAKRKEQTKRENAQRAIEQEKRLAEWRTGKDVGYLYSYGVPAALRIREVHEGNRTEENPESHFLETSQGVRVSIRDAQRTLSFVRSVHAMGQEWQTNGHTFHIGAYKLDRIEANGTIHAGCHVVTMAEIERIAPALEALAVS